MEVINDNAAMLSNYEVYSLLTELKAKNGDGKKGVKLQQNLATISYETVKYLEKTPCKYQTPDIIATFIKALQPFKLTRAEKLQLLNQRPTTAVEIQLIIEESEERLTEDQTEQLLELIGQTLPGDPSQEVAEGEEGNDEPMESDDGGSGGGGE